MRIKTCASLLSLAVVASCATDPVVGPVPAPELPTTSTTIDLSATGSTPLYSSAAYAINDSGVIVGVASLSASDSQRAVVWTPPDYHVHFLPDLGIGVAEAVSIGNDGTIAGNLCESRDYRSPCHPVYWRAGVLHQLAGVGRANDVCSCDGHTLVGHLLINGTDHGVVWVDDIPIDVGHPDDRPSVNLVAIAHGNIIATVYDGVAEGDTAYQTQRRPYRWSPSTGWVSLGASEFGVYDVNARGSVVGGFSALWLDGSNQPTGLTGPGHGLPFRINDHDVVGGQCIPDDSSAQNVSFPCEWTAQSGWYALTNDSTDAFDGLNNLNEAVGTADVDGRPAARLWKP